MSKKRTLIQIPTNIEDIKDFTCCHCHKKTNKTYKWFIDSEQGYIFCDECGVELNILIEANKAETIETFVVE